MTLRYVAFVNNRVGYEVLRWLVDRDEPPSAVVVHPEARARFRTEILDLVRLPADRVFNGAEIRDPATIGAIAAVSADLGLSVLFDYVLPPALLDKFPLGGLNLHPALLPYNRGQYANVWSIVEGTPAGVTLHYMDEGIDTGDIVAQREVPIEPVDTGRTLYEKLEDAAIDLFREAWLQLARGETLPRVPQPRDGGTSHRTRDVDGIDLIDLERSYRARDLINVLRARTFPPYRGAYFMENGRQVQVRLDLFYLDEAPVPGAAAAVAATDPLE